MGFRTPIDIANRALQHCGVPRISATLGFTENSKQAKEVAFCYDKLRRAELRRNVWAFSTRRAALRAIDVNTMVLTPTLWSPSVTYFVGSIVTDQNGTLWISQAPNNLNNDPLNSYSWQQYFGPLTAPLYATGGSYHAGEIVYTAAGDGTYRVYLSLVDANSDSPSAPTQYDATAVYFKNQVVMFGLVSYMSLIDLNKGNQPSLAPALFNLATTYALNAKVGASDGVIYQSLSNGNVGHDPVSDGGVHWLNTGVLNPWTTIFTGGTGSLKWLQIGGAEFPFGVGLQAVNLIYPIGAGPSSQSSTRNVFKLPANWLREAQQDPNNNGLSWLGAPGGPRLNDWAYENGYIVSRFGDVIIYRFAADISDVTLMDDMFCEGLAARIGMEVCEPLTQSDSQIKTIATLYKLAISDARTVNGIETGSDEPPDDEYLTVRL
jgi:hypothetical protein